MYKLLQKIRNAFAFIDDILIVTKGTLKQYMEKVEELTQNKVRKVQNSADKNWVVGIQIIDRRGEASRRENSGHHRSIGTNLAKRTAITDGALNRMNPFIPNLANLWAPLRPLLSKKIESKWEEERKTAFQTIKKEILKITEIKHFKRNQPVRIICDASREGLGAVLQQKTEEGWRTTHFASRFLTIFEQKYSIKELKLLAVVWAMENFRNYVYGIQFVKPSDHRALGAFLKGNREIEHTQAD